MDRLKASVEMSESSDIEVLQRQILKLEAERDAAAACLAQLRQQLLGDKVLWGRKLRLAEQFSTKLDQQLRLQREATGRKEVVDRLNAEVLQVERENQKKAEECRRLLELCEEVNEHNTSMLRRNGELQVQLSSSDSRNIELVLQKAERLKAENQGLLRTLRQQEAMSAQQSRSLEQLSAEAWEGQRLYSAQISSTVSRAQSPVDRRKVERKEMKRALKKLQQERNSMEIEGRQASEHLERLIATKSRKLRHLSM